jgi:hypothetical protein
VEAGARKGVRVRVPPSVPPSSLLAKQIVDASPANVETVVT